MRKISHTQLKEPLLEYILSKIRSNQAIKYIKDKSVVADLGCGYNGNFLKKISKKINRGIGYDVSVTKNNLPKNVFLKTSDLNKKISDHKNYFNTVTALAVLEHVENPEEFLIKIKSMLKKNGKVIITTPHKNGKVILEILSRFGLISRDEIYDHKTYFNKKSLIKLLSKNKFRVCKIYSFGILYLNLICVAEKIN